MYSIGIIADKIAFVNKIVYLNLNLQKITVDNLCFNTRTQNASATYSIKN